MFTEEVGYKMEVLEDGIIQVCRVTHILKDGVEIAKQYHRHVIGPGQDTKDQNEKVKAVASAVWTKEVVDAFKAKKAEREAEMAGKG